MGKCPVYVLTVQPNGTVIFEGLEDTKIKGKVESKLNEEKIKMLTAEIDEANFFALKDNYSAISNNCPEVWTDSPTVILSIKLRGKEKTIPHYLGCEEKSKVAVSGKFFPQQLFNLENKIDEIVETKRWIGERK